MIKVGIWTMNILLLAIFIEILVIAPNTKTNSNTRLESNISNKDLDQYPTCKNGTLVYFSKGIEANLLDKQNNIIKCSSVILEKTENGSRYVIY